MNPYFLLSIAWIFFYALHSFMANSYIKSRVENVLKSHYRFYRLAFNFISILLFAGILWFQFSIPEQYFLSVNLFTQLAGGIIFLAGTVLLLIAFSSFNKLEFAGIEQLNSTDRGQANTSELITDSGMYAYVRHPLYFAVILMFLGALLFRPTIAMLIFTGITFIYLPIGVRLEEQKLIEEFGKSYIEYRRKVKMLIPFVF
ncbi:MAG: isoprenylcysteine carboxylmethyltransferase family protein [Chitinophagales bacterium]